MKRRQLIEFEDLDGFPSSVREGITDYLRFFFSVFRLYLPSVSIIKNLLEKTGESAIIDLCSGGGGPIMHIVKKLDASGIKDFRVILTDKFPNLSAKKFISAKTNGRITFHEKTIDAGNVPKELKGIRVMYSAFHHFDDKKALEVLQNSVDCNSPIAIFEGGERRLLYILGVILSTPLLTLFFTPFIRPFRWIKIFFTYVIPLIPLFAFTDGIVSTIRVREHEELLILTRLLKKTRLCGNQEKRKLQ